MISVTETIEGHTYTAEFQSAQDCGYKYRGLLLDLPGGDSISIRKIGRKWVETLVVNRIGRKSTEHATRQDAIDSAAGKFFGEAHTVELSK